MHSKVSAFASTTWRCLLLVSLGASIGFGQTLKAVAKFDLPGPGGKRFDYLTVDAILPTGILPKTNLLQ